MDQALHDRADQIFEEALGQTGAKDPREFYRKRLREMKADNPEAYGEAVAYYENDLVPSIAEAGDDFWEVPYLPIDPRDLGRSYEAVVRVNSQSGKGGVAFLLEHNHGMRLPRRLQIEFSKQIQQVTESTGLEITSDAIWEQFRSEYLSRTAPIELIKIGRASCRERV